MPARFIAKRWQQWVPWTDTTKNYVNLNDNY